MVNTAPTRKYERITEQELDDSWKDFNNPTPSDNEILAKCVCVDIRKPKGRTSIVLTFREINDPFREVSSWFNVEPVKGKNDKNECRMSPNSKLAKLYRISIGIKPPRLNRARQAAKHLIGILFYIQPESKSERGLESTIINPYELKQSNSWGVSGKLYQIKNRQNLKTCLVDGRQLVGNKSANGGQSVGKESATTSSLDYKHNDVERFSITKNQLTINKAPTTNEPNAIISTETTLNYEQKIHETEIEYFDRVIDESCFLK